MADPGSPRYVEPGWFTRTVFNPSVAWLTRAGFSVWGSRELRVRGRTSGEWRTTPVNLLSLEGARYLVAPRGQTQWVKNLRVAGEGELRVGHHTEAFRAEEVGDDDKVEILRVPEAVEARGRRLLRRRERDVARRRAPADRSGSPRVPHHVLTSYATHDLGRLRRNMEWTRSQWSSDASRL